MNVERLKKHYENTDNRNASEQTSCSLRPVANMEEKIENISGITTKTYPST